MFVCLLACRQCLTHEDWHLVMHDAIRARGPIGFVYFVLLMFSGRYSSTHTHICVCGCVCVCACVCVRACVRACVRVRARACVWAPPVASLIVMNLFIVMLIHNQHNAKPQRVHTFGFSERCLPLPDSTG